MNEAWTWSAVEAVRRLRSGEISAFELLTALRERVEKVDGHVNALPTRCFERGEQQARLLEKLPLGHRGPLAGLPWPIKDTVAVAGVRTTYGSIAYQDYIPATSDYVVSAIEAAGGIVFAKSNTPEFEAGGHTFNDVFGRTLNPWDSSRSPGGSSGGAAAAVATGMAYVAQGSDFACSLRYPAAFCNVVGLRPTPGVVPQGPSVLPFQTLSVMGPIARSVADAGLALDGMAQHDPRDPRSRPRLCSFQDAASSPQRPLRAAFSMTLGLLAVDDAVRAVVRDAVNGLAAAGLAIEETQPDLRAGDHAFRVLRAFQFSAMWHDALRDHRDKLKPEVVWNIEEGLKLRSLDLADAEASRGIVRLAMLSFLDEHDVLITPTVPVEPFPAEQRYVERIGDQECATYLDWLALGYAIAVCGCPAISIPCGNSPNGLPIGLQIVAKPYCEAHLLSVAAWCESILQNSLIKPIDPVGLAMRPQQVIH